MSANSDLLQALLERDKALDTWTDEELRAVLEVLEKANTQALGVVSSSWGDISATAAGIAATYSAASSRIMADAEARLPAKAQEEGAFIRILLGDVSGLPIRAPSIAWADILAKPIDGSTLGQLADALGVNQAIDVVAEVQRGLEQGKRLDEVVSAIRGEVVQRAKWKGGKYIPGVYSGGVFDTRQANVFARTAIMHVGNAAREAAYSANEDIIKAYMRVETLDDRTCIECGVMDGKTYKTDEPRPSLPAHPNCRGFYVPILKSFRELGTDIDELPAGTRASMDGAVPQYTKWRDFVAKKPEEFLGPGRAALYKQGMSVDAFLKDGKLVPIKELKR